MQKHNLISAAWIRIGIVALVTAGGAALFAKGIDLSHRYVPIVISEAGILSGSLESRFIPGGKSLLLKPELSSEWLHRPYAFYVPGLTETTVTLNGNELYVMPIDRSDGRVYNLDQRYLVEGQNSLRIDRADAQSWAGLAMFSLRDTYEEVHFADAFGEPAADGDVFTREVPMTSLQTQYDVLWYDCTWIPAMNTAYMQTGSQVIMGARSTVNGLQVVELDFDMNPNGNGGAPMVLDYVDSGPGTSALSWTYISSSLSPRLRVTLPAPANVDDEFQIRIGYHGAPNDNQPKEIFNTNSLYASTHSASGYPTRPVVYSVSQPYGARRWWPCKDHPSDKATTTVQRIIVPKQTGYTLTAVSNGLLDPVIDHGSTLEYRWRNDYPIATYLMSMAISDYLYRGGTYTSMDGQVQMPVGSYIYPPDDSFEGNGYLGTLIIMNYFADTFGEYPFLDQKYVTAAWNITWAMEHQTATSTTGGSSGGLADGLTRRNVHELAHQWFGNKLTTANWDHLWLNEGFATYAEALFFGHYSGQWRYHQIVNGWNPSSTTPIVGPATDGFAGSVAYDRGAWVLHMLRFVLGDDAFFKVIRDYAAQDYTSVLSQPGGGADLDFQTVVEQSAGLAQGSMFPFFRQWLYSPDTSYADRPRYSYSAAYDVETSSVRVQVVQTQGKLPFAMPVEIGLVAADGSTTSVVVPPNMSITTFPLDSFIPHYSQLDPANWVLNRQSASILTASLPPAVIGEPYATALQAAEMTGSETWQKLGGPGWLNVSSNGTIYGTPPVAGLYHIGVRLANISGGYSVDATYSLFVGDGSSRSGIVINEFLYQNSDGADNAEYVELLNTTSDPVDLSGWQLVPVRGSTGEPTSVVVIPGGTVLPAGSYYVIGNAATINGVYGSAVALNTGWSDALLNGAAAIVLKDNAGLRVDSVAYQSDVVYGPGSHTSLALAEGSTGRGISFDISKTSQNAVFGRLPDGLDTGNNLRDFALVPPTPGQANASGVTLPFFDDFNNGARPEWRAAFDDPVRTATPGQAGKPFLAPPAPAGGNVLEVFDHSGGGDVVYLPGAFEKLNVEGFIWLPQTFSSTYWSTGIGIGTRAESAWFSSSAGYGLENGFYLEFQNGPGVSLKGGRVPDASAGMRLIAANSSGCPGVGLSGFSATVLGTPRSPSAGFWYPFRFFMDIPENRLYASIGDREIYNGPLPEDTFYTPGGVTVGFRENHSGPPTALNYEGTWVDNIKVDTNTSLDSRVSDYYIY